MFLSSFTKFYSRLIAKGMRRAWDLVFPSLCLFCRGPATFYICLACWQDLPSLPYSCIQCAHILPQQPALLKCGECLKNPPRFDRVYALFPYAPPISELIIQLKFQHKLHHAHALGKLLANMVPNWYRASKLPDLILPVPLHISRLRERGFNQAVEIARPIARKLASPLDLAGIRRIKHTAA